MTGVLSEQAMRDAAPLMARMVLKHRANLVPGEGDAGSRPVAVCPSTPSPGRHAKDAA